MSPQESRPGARLPAHLRSSAIVSPTSVIVTTGRGVSNLETIFASSPTSAYVWKPIAGCMEQRLSKC